MAIFNDVLKAYKKGLNINLFLKEINSDCSDKKQTDKRDLFLISSWPGVKLIF